MHDVVIAGGGPAGATLGLLLARAGHRPLILDRAVFPRAKPCAEYLSPGTVRLLADIGLLDRVSALPHSRLRGFRLYANGRQMQGAFGRARGWGTAPPYGMGVPRITLDAVLLDAAREAGAEVHEGMRVIDVLQEEGRVRGVIARGAAGLVTYRAAVVVGADGVRGVVGRRLGMIEPRPRMMRFGLVAHVGGIDRLDAFGEMHTGRDGYCGIAPLADGLANVAMVLRPPAGDGAGRHKERFFLQQLAGLPGLAERISRAALAGPLLTTGPLAFRARRLAGNGVLLAGDAGGFYDPFTGQGIYKAIRSAHLAEPVLRAALASGDTSRRALRPYERARRRDERGGFAVEWLIQRFVRRPSLLGHAVARLGRRPALADTMVGVTGDVLPARRVLNPIFLAQLAL